MPAMRSGRPLAHYDRIFNAVFQPPIEAPLIKSFPDPETIAWNQVTLCLSLPRTLQAAADTSGSSDIDVESFRHILTDDETRRRLVDWLANEAQEYQNLFVEPKIHTLWGSRVACNQAVSILSQTLDILVSLHSTVVSRLDQWLASHQESDLVPDVDRLRSATLERSYANALHSLPSKRLFKTVAFVLHELICSWLLASDEHTKEVYADASHSLLTRLRESGLGGDSGQRAFAHAMNAVIDTYVQSSEVKVDWIGQQSVADKLRNWIRNTFIPVARDGLRCLMDDPDAVFFETETVEWENVALEKLAKQRIKYTFEYVRAWDRSAGAIADLKEYIQTVVEGKVLLANTFGQQMARRILHAGVTTSELLSMYINVICAFKALDPRGVLLDKVAAPLRAYLRQRDDTVRIIAASFLADVDVDGKVITPSDEVCSDLAREISLSESEDIKIDEKGLDWDDMTWVPDPMDAGPDYKKSKSDDIMAFMLTLFERGDFIQEVQALLGERLLVPETAQSELDKEIRLVELFKTRFGPDGLQSCEVMLRDILESRRMNTTLRPQADGSFPTVQEVYAGIPKDGITIQGLLKKFQARVPRNSLSNQQFIKVVKDAAVSDKASSLLLRKPEGSIPPEDHVSRFSTLILSSFFWPSLREDVFDVPPPISAMQEAYEQDFERIKNLRKLHWLSALGRVAVELELEDRTVKVEAVQTWQASVIYAFHDEDADNQASGAPVRKTVQDLAESLSMEDMLVRNAINFWIGQRVLVEVDTDTYQVLERLPTEEEERAAPAQAPMAQPDAAISAVKSQDAVLRDNKDMYELFMIGMLTNGGAMDAARITMMMKLVVPGGYAFGEDETKWLLGDLVAQGKVIESGSSFAIKK